MYILRLGFFLSSNSNNCCLLYFNANIVCSFTKKASASGGLLLPPIILWDRRPWCVSMLGATASCVCKNGWTGRDAVWTGRYTRVGQGNMCQMRVQTLHGKKAILRRWICNEWLHGAEGAFAKLGLLWTLGRIYHGHPYSNAVCHVNVNVFYTRYSFCFLRSFFHILQCLSVEDRDRLF